LQTPAFEKLHVYQLADQISDLSWKLIQQWKYFEKDTIGKQLVRAADSVGANIAEGSGRGTSKETSRFAKIARGSLFEVRHWLRRAQKQELLTESEMIQFQEIFNTLAPKLSAYINFLSKKH